MNKLFLIVLAVCLVSTHAFVKRDAPTPAPQENLIETIQKKISDATKTFADTAKDAFNPDTMKKQLDDLVNNIKKALDDIKPKDEKKA